MLLSNNVDVVREKHLIGQTLFYYQEISYSFSVHCRKTFYFKIGTDRYRLWYICSHFQCKERRVTELSDVFHVSESEYCLYFDKCLDFGSKTVFPLTFVFGYPEDIHTKTFNECTIGLLILKWSTTTVLTN